MEGIKSILEFKNYVVNEITYKKNNEFNKDKAVSISLDVEPQIKIDNNDMIIDLVTTIFENSKQNNYPFEMKVSITGYFSTSGESPEKFQANAIAILYPYIRAIVSTYTASANISPLILPAININAMLEARENNK